MRRTTDTQWESSQTINLDSYLEEVEERSVTEWDVTPHSAPEEAATAALQSLINLSRFLHSLEDSLSYVPETVADGAYTILEPLDGGDLPTVFLAHDREFDRKVVIKLAHPLRANRTGQGMDMEGRVLARLPHDPGVVAVFDTDRAHASYIVMEYVGAQNLRDLIERRYRRGGGSGQVEESAVPSLRSIREDIECLLRIAKAIDFCHRHGVVHRDIKPENIVFREGDAKRPCLVDLGLGQFEQAVEARGTLQGTMPYLAPEHLEAQRLDVLPVSDQYSYGVLACELLTGQLVRGAEEARAVLSDAGHQYSADLQAVLASTLSYDPAGRYASMREVAKDLRSILDRRPVGAREAPVLHRAYLFGKRNLASLMVAGISIAAAVTLLVVIGLHHRRQLLDEVDDLRTAVALSPEQRQLDSVEVAGLLSRANQFESSVLGWATPGVSREALALQSKFREDSKRHFESAREEEGFDAEEWAELFALQAAVFGPEGHVDEPLMLSGCVFYPDAFEGRLRLFRQFQASESEGSLLGELSGVTQWREVELKQRLRPGCYRLLEVSEQGDILHEIPFRRREGFQEPLRLEFSERSGSPWTAQSVVVPTSSYEFQVSPTGTRYLREGVAFRLSPLVTWTDFELFLRDQGRASEIPFDRVRKEEPAEVTWQDASAFAAWSGARIPEARELICAAQEASLSEQDRAFLQLGESMPGEWVLDTVVQDGADRMYFADIRRQQLETAQPEITYLSEDPGGRGSYEPVDGALSGVNFRLARTEGTLVEWLESQEVSNSF